MHFHWNFDTTVFPYIIPEKFKDQHCGSEFCVSTWLRHGTQAFGQTLVQILLWRDFLGEINI